MRRGRRGKDLLLVLGGWLLVVERPQELRVLVVAQLPLNPLIDVLLLFLQTVNIFLLYNKMLLNIEQLEVEPVEAGLLLHHLGLQVRLELLVLIDHLELLV